MEAVRRGVGVDPNQPSGIGIGKRLDEDGVDHREHGGGGPEPESDREHDGRGKDRRAYQRANALADVEEQRVHGRASRMSDELRGVLPPLPPEPRGRRRFAIALAPALIQLLEVAQHRRALVAGQEKAQGEPCEEWRTRDHVLPSTTSRPSQSLTRARRVSRRRRIALGVVRK